MVKMTNDQITDFANFLHSKFCMNNHTDECPYYRATDDEWTRLIREHCRGLWLEAAQEVITGLDIIRSS